MQKKPVWLEEVLTNVKIKALNEMQVASMEAQASEKDIILLSATGSGKTLAFLLPLVEQLQAAGNQTKALIIVPSRELAIQIEHVFKSMQLNLKVTCCYGGHKREIEENNLKQAPSLLIGTPGRLADHIRRGNITVASIETLVLDEFDKSLELGFQEEMSFIIGSLPSIKKRVLTSATNLEEIPSFVGLNEPQKLDFLTGNEDSDTGLAIKVLPSPEKDKLETLFRLVCMLGNRSTIIFCNHREISRTHQRTVERT
jgi:superfamily II DNA/RNA helicase